MAPLIQRMKHKIVNSIYETFQIISKHFYYDSLNRERITNPMKAVDSIMIWLYFHSNDKLLS